MSVRRVNPRFWFPLALAVVSAIAAADAVAQDVIHVYGSEGPFPAIHQAAQVFGEQKQVKIEVMSGPTDQWLDSAKRDADVIFASAEFMMSDFVHAGEVKIDVGSITPLYMRPSAILVRPGNPKQIQDFAGLLRPGIRVMVVTGSGQTGLWEDMAGKQGDIRTIRALRENIVFFAANSTVAVRTWREKDDIDAWLTWSIWHLPLHDHADLVPVSEDYRVYRQCVVAATEQGAAKPLAMQFIAFLASPEGAKIFRSWDWMVPDGPRSPVTVQTDVAVVCRIDKDEWKDGVGVGLTGTRRVASGYREDGILPDQVHIIAVLHGDAAYWVLKDEPYHRFAGRETANPNKAVVQELLDLEVSVEVCGQTMREHGWTPEDILPGVEIVPDAYPRIADLQLQGYAYLRF